MNEKDLEDLEIIEQMLNESDIDCEICADAVYACSPGGNQFRLFAVYPAETAGCITPNISDPEFIVKLKRKIERCLATSCSECEDLPDDLKCSDEDEM